MEVTSKGPKKRQRSSSANQLSSNLSVVECIREFKLPRTFPSMVKYAKMESNTTTSNQITTNKSSNGIQTNNNSNKDTQSSPKLQKLKLKSPDGRDLGEFDVQILPQCKDNKSKPVISSINTQLKTNNALRVGVKTEDNSQKFVQLSSGIKGSSPTLSQSSKPIKYLSKSLKINVPDRTQGVLIPIPSNMIANSSIENNQSIITSSDNQQKNKIFVVQQSNNTWQMMKNNQLTNSLPVIIKSHIMENNTQSDGLEVVNIGQIQNSNIKSMKGHEIKTIKNPVISHKNDDSIIYTGLKRKMDGTIVKSAIIKDKKFLKAGSSNIIMKLEGLEENGSGENLVLVVPNDDNNSLDNNHVINYSELVETKRQYLRNSHGTVNLIRRGRKDNLSNKPRYNIDNPIFFNNSLNSNDNLVNNDTFNDNSVDDDISNKLSIVGHAISTIGDEELKAKALKALEDCGIGLERFIPIKPAVNKMSIKESQCQTNVFGLLDKMNFIKVTDEDEKLERIQEIERNYEDCTVTSKEMSKEALKFSRDLNKMLDSFWVDKDNVENMREILKVNPLVEKAYNLLVNDFKNCKKYDKNGLLNIHKAVLSNQGKAVRRQISVLKNCKESIDLRTSDGQTSLELAVQHQASPVIVNMLLEAGASPTAFEPAHDSALTIASKQSSPILPKIISYLSMTDPAINNADSEGFTALHYCAMYGNEEGVNELIRANVDLNARDCKSGRTALFHALENEFLSICKNLLAHGAKGNIPNFAGQTVFTLFDEDKHHMLKDALQKTMK